MKFSCDNCGAQYFISDDKLGSGGVKKARCKKCNHVIFLHPPTERGPYDAEEPPTTVGPGTEPSSVPSVVPDEVSATSSALGLSREFEAMGFEEQTSLEAASPAYAGASNPSPALGADATELGAFGSSRIGGSSVEGLSGPNEPEGETMVTSDPFGMNGSNSDDDGSAFDQSLAAALAESTRRTDLDSLSTGAGSGGVLPAHREADAPDTRMESFDGSNGANGTNALSGGAVPNLHADLGEPTAVAPQPSAPPSSSSTWDEDDSSSLGRAFSDVQRNELAEMQSSLQDELTGLTAQLENSPSDSNSDAQPVPASSELEGTVDSHSRLGALAEMAAEVEGGASGGESAGSSESSGALDSEAAQIASEIGDAFEAMFDGGAEGQPSGGDDPFGGLGNSEPSAGDDPFGGLGGDVAPAAPPAETRVFDSDAIAKVEEEQQRAESEVAPDSEESEWFVAIDDEQVGPLSTEDVEQRWNEGALNAESLCWRQGMADWTAIKLVSELAHLGPMDQSLPAEDDNPSVEIPAAPPQIEMHAEPEPPPSEPEPLPPEDEPAWKPSAASALASLAAAELSAPATSPVNRPMPRSDMAASSIPASDALEKLLDGNKDAPSATRFGAAEQSESYVRPLPRRADTVSSIPLRDPAAENRRSLPVWLVPAAIVAAALIIAVSIIFALGGDSPSDEPEIATKSKLTDPPPETSVTDTKPEAVAAVAPPPPPPPKPVAPPPPPVESSETVAPPPPAPTKKRSKPRRKSSTPRTRRTSPPPPPPPPPPVEDDDDLLRPNAKRSRLPRQLDESDILGVIRKNRRDVRRCLERQANADPSVEGKMTVELIIQKSGRPKGVSVSPGRFKSAVIGKCITASVRKWRFPRFSGPPMPLDFPVAVRGGR